MGFTEMLAEEKKDGPETTLDRVRLTQSKEWHPIDKEEKPHEPDTLFIGCIDARLDPRRDIGFPMGNALIRRTIAALVPPKDPDGNAANDLSETIHYALTHDIKHIIVAGHTMCGGLKACQCDHGDLKNTLPKVHEHLHIISGDKSSIEAVEAESIRTSLNNLLTYPEIKDAFEAGRITIDGWRFDTATHDIDVYNKDSHQFERMQRTPLAPGEPKPDDTLEAVHRHVPPPLKDGIDPNTHQPDMLMLTDIYANVNPIGHLNVEYGKALIYRGYNPCAVDRTDERAAIEFASKAMKVKDIVLMLPANMERSHEQAETEVKAGIEKLQTFCNSDPIIKDRITSGDLKLNGWVLDAQTRRIDEFDSQKMTFKPMGIDKEKAREFVKI